MSEQKLHQMWKDKYRPQRLSDMLLNEEHLEFFGGFLAKRTIPNITFYGIHGIGKSSLAMALVRELMALGVCDDCYYLYLNASDNNNVDYIRTTITDFVSRAVPEGMMKVVIFDEANSLTFAAQQCLKNLIESCSDDTRFILTSNYVSEIDPAILSRCRPINIGTSVESIVKRMISIVKAEGVKMVKADIEPIFNIVKNNYPDIRASIDHIEACCLTGAFKYVEPVKNDKVEELCQKILEELNIDPIKARELWIKSEELFSGDYLKLTTTMFNVANSPQHKLLIGRGYATTSQMIDKEIGFYTTILELWNYNLKSIAPARK